MAASRIHDGEVVSWDSGGEGLSWYYLDGVRRAGAEPAIVAPADDGDATGMLRRFDGLLLAGGPDLDPASFGATPHPSVYGVDMVRDGRELALASAALTLGLPLLAICRGLQILNVALGGTLVQHLPDLSTGLAHGVPVGAGEPTVHPVAAAPGSRLAGVGPTLGRCVSIHHQSVDVVAAGLEVTGRAPDGVIEALETPIAGPWCLAVQWHPERSAAVDPEQQAIFDAFVGAAG